MPLGPLSKEVTDGVIVMRRHTGADSRVLIDGRDEEFHRFMGEGSANPDPLAVILNDQREVVGWVDYDVDRDWIVAGEVNIGYSVLPEYRGRGYASRAVELLLSFLAEQAEISTATLLIDPDNAPSIAVAARTRFRQCDNVNGQLFFKLALEDRTS